LTNFLKYLDILGDSEKPQKTEPTMAKDSYSNVGELTRKKSASFSPAPEPATQSFIAQEGYPSPFVSKEASQGGAEIAKTSDKLVKQALAIDLGGQALDLIGGLQNIKAQTEDRLAEISAQHGIAIENIRGNANLRNLAQQSSMTRSIIQRMKNLDRLSNTGGIQRQQFMENV
jgi:hypothetical protein